MSVAGRSPDLDALGAEIHELMAELYPIPRSITGDGVRETLSRIGKRIPLEVREVPSGTPVLDWTVPPEWNLRDAYIADPAGNRIVDAADCNLHVVGYSVPVRERLSLAELRDNVFTLPEHPDRIPYRTSYYDRSWGFCLTQRQLDGLAEGEYEVCVDATLQDGSLAFGEYYLEGERDEEILLSAHVCHPSLANDNLSGIAVATLLAQHLADVPRRFSYRFLFIPGTIGSITWLALNEEATRRIRGGLVLAGLGDPGRSTYKRSRHGATEIDGAAAHVLRHAGDHAIEPFEPYGYDERQYCSPGFDLPVGCLMRTPHGRYPEYHTSADDMSFVKPSFLADSFAKCLAIVSVMEGNRTYRNLSPKGEPQLGRRGLYRAIGGSGDGDSARMAMLWVLNLSDGEHSLLDIADRASLPFDLVREAADALEAAGLLAER